MTQRDIIKRISVETGLAQKQVKDVFNSFKDILKESIEKEDKLKIINLFSLKFNRFKTKLNGKPLEGKYPILKISKKIRG